MTATSPWHMGVLFCAPTSLVFVRPYRGPLARDCGHYTPSSSALGEDSVWVTGSLWATESSRTSVWLQRVFTEDRNPLFRNIREGIQSVCSHWETLTPIERPNFASECWGTSPFHQC